MTNKYKIASSEVLEIIKHFREEEKSKIPQEFIKVLESKSQGDSFECRINFFKPLSENNLIPETRSLLALVYRKYLCDEKGRQEFDMLMKENEDKYLKLQREKYNPANIFKK